MDYRVGPGRSGLRTPPLLFLKKDPHRPCLFRAKKGRGGGGGPGGRKSTTPPKELKPRQGTGGGGGGGPHRPYLFYSQKDRGRPSIFSGCSAAGEKSAPPGLPGYRGVPFPPQGLGKASTAHYS